jgi:hypothetical protein
VRKTGQENGLVLFLFFVRVCPARGHIFLATALTAPLRFANVSFELTVRFPLPPMGMAFP